MASESELVDGRCEPGLDFSTPGWPHVFYQSLTSVLAQYMEVQAEYSEVHGKILGYM